jgi:Mg2+ and Co2+ transporter CorA
MIWLYSVQEKDFIAIDVTSLTQLKELAEKKWVWIDIFNPSEKELEILSELLGDEPKVVKKFKDLMDQPIDVKVDNCDFFNYEKVNDYGTVVFPSINIDEKLFVHPIILSKKKKMIITWAEEGHKHSNIIKKTIKRLREGVEASQDLNTSLVISVLFHELALNNSKEILSIRENIDKLEEKALYKGGKKLIHSVFSLKKMISKISRIMIEEKAFMLDVEQLVVPLTKLNVKSKPIVNEAIELVDREIDFLDSYSRSLDSIWTLQDLSSIHKVESSINYLTIVLVISTVFLVFFEFLAFLEFFH